MGLEPNLAPWIKNHLCQLYNHIALKNCCLKSEILRANLKDNVTQSYNTYSAWVNVDGVVNAAW